MDSPGMNHYLKAAASAARWRAEYRKSMMQCRFDTIAVHGIYSMQEALDFNQGSIIEPIYMSTSQAYRDADEMEAALGYKIPTWCYSRIANPTVYYLEGMLAMLEAYGSGEETSCIATSSGMSAIQSAVNPFLLPDPADPSRPVNFVATAQVYGGTFQQFSVRKDRERRIQWRKVVHSEDLSEWESLIDDNTRFLYGELPSNPCLGFFDIAAVAKLAHKHEIPLIVDSTVATPALLRPIQQGADIVVQSVTKSLFTSGFGIAGAVISRKNMVSRWGDPEMKADYASYLKLLPNRDHGPNLSPMNAVLALNDIRTIRTRMDVMSRSALKIARALDRHPHVERVEYLGLETHPLHELAKRYLFLVDSEFDEQYGEPVNRYGHLLSFLVKGDHAQTRQVFNALQRIWRATDLGRIKSVATIPAISTHSQQGEEARKLAGIPCNLIRLCVGMEHPDDILKDLIQALEVLDGKKAETSSPVFSAGGASSSSLRV